MDLKTPYQQKKFGYCTVYTYANLFRDDYFLKFLKNKKYKGTTFELENSMLSNSPYSNLSLEYVLTINDTYDFTLPKNLVYKILTYDHGDSVNIKYPIVPYICSVQLRKKFYHSVFIMNCKGLLLYSDPYNKKYKVIENKNQLYKNFLKIVDIKRLVIKKGDEKYWATLDGDVINFKY